MRFSARDFVKTFRSALDLDVDRRPIFVTFRVMWVHERAPRMAYRHGYNSIEILLGLDLWRGQRSTEDYSPHKLWSCPDRSCSTK